MVAKTFTLDPVADPFGERVSDTYSERHSVLGGHFDFVTSRQRLLRLARSAFGGLSTRRLPASTPSLQVHLKLMPESPGTWRDEPPPMQYFAGAGLLGGAMDASNLAVIQPSMRHALVCISPRLLRSHYYARSELLEFAVYTLAAQAGHLAPLHAACIGSGRRGVLIVGNSGTGKSTLAWQCAMLGLDFLSEDSTFVDPRTLRATGLASYVHLHEDSLQFVDRAALRSKIRQAPVIRRRSGAPKYEVDLRKCGIRLAAAPLDLCGLVFLSRRAARTASLLRPVAHEQAITRFKREQLYAAQQPGWNILAQSLRRIPAFELRRGEHPREAASAVRALLGD